MQIPSGMASFSNCKTSEITLEILIGVTRLSEWENRRSRKLRRNEKLFSTFFIQFQRRMPCRFRSDLRYDRENKALVHINKMLKLDWTN